MLERVDREFEPAIGEELWELFHENSKTNRFERHPTFAIHPTDEQVVRVMDRLRRVKPYRDRPKFDLPQDFPAAKSSLDEAMFRRVTAREFSGGSMPLALLAKVLYMSYGVTRSNEDTHFPRPMRVIPSGGALYPLELYVCALRVDGLEPGLYHYDPEDHQLDVLRLGDEPGERTAHLFVQPELVDEAAALILVSAVFYRSTFKYGARGYRFVLLEAGHLAQNATLVTQAQGYASALLGGYFDRDVDRYLGIDGLNESVVYAIPVGTA